MPLSASHTPRPGFQPADKLFKIYELSFEDILHYQKIIVAITETDRLMKEIDEVEVEWFTNTKLYLRNIYLFNRDIVKRLYLLIINKTIFLK